MIINVKKEDVFIPEWNGNRDEPEAEQIKFYHRFLSTADREKFVYMRNLTQGQAQKLYMVTQKDDFDIDEYVESNTREFIQDSEGIARKITIRIENLTLKYEQGTEEPIDTIEKFYDAPDAYRELRAEYEGYVLNLSARADSKN